MDIQPHNFLNDLAQIENDYETSNWKTFTRDFTCDICGIYAMRSHPVTAKAILAGKKTVNICQDCYGRLDDISNYYIRHTGNLGSSLPFTSRVQKYLRETKKYLNEMNAVEYAVTRFRSSICVHPSVELVRGAAEHLVVILRFGSAGANLSEGFVNDLTSHIQTYIDPDAHINVELENLGVYKRDVFFSFSDQPALKEHRTFVNISFLNTELIRKYKEESIAVTQLRTVPDSNNQQATFSVKTKTKKLGEFRCDLEIIYAESEPGCQLYRVTDSQ